MHNLRHEVFVWFGFRVGGEDITLSLSFLLYSDCKDLVLDSEINQKPWNCQFPLHS